MAGQDRDEMTIKELWNSLLDLSIVFSFDRSGFLRHCPHPLQRVDLSGFHGIVTGASSGIGLAAAKGLIQQGMNGLLIGRDRDKLKRNFEAECQLPNVVFHSLDMADLKKIHPFAKGAVDAPIDLLVHNAGAMPSSLTITQDGFEEMFASQVLGPFILTKILADTGKLRKGCRVIFVSSGGMYLQKLDISDLLFKNRPYNKYQGYANAKRAQVILSELFSKHYPSYLFSAMHPGWADTAGVRQSLPLFRKVLNNRLRSAEEGADTILWLAATPGYPSGKFWFDRRQAKTAIFNRSKAAMDDEETLWNYCESVFQATRGV